MIFVSLTEAPLPDPNPTQPNTLTRNRAETKPNGAETEPNGAEMDRNQAFRGGTGGGFVGVGGGWGVVREKEYHYAKLANFTRHSLKSLPAWRFRFHRLLSNLRTVSQGTFKGTELR